MKAMIWNFNAWIKETDPEILSDKYDGILKKCGFSVLGKMEYVFRPQGYTKLWLLAESHCAIHTFPEENKTYIELSSCNREMYDRFVEMESWEADICLKK